MAEWVHTKSNLYGLVARGFFFLTNIFLKILGGWMDN